MAGMARRLAPAAAIAVAACGAATANIFAADGADPRRFVAADSPEARRLAPVGAIASEYVLLDKRGFGHVPPGAGTAFLVSPCYAMTNYHVLFGDQTLTPDPMSAYTLEVRFAIGDARGVPAGAADKDPMRARGRVRYAGSLDGSAPDIALVRLDGCPGRRLGWYELAAATGGDIDGVAVDQAGYSQDRGMRRLSVQHGCHIRAAAPRQGWLLHDCASRDGASGSPLIDRTPGGVPRVVAINVGELAPTRAIQPAFDRRRANVAIDLATLAKMPLVADAIARDRAGARNPIAGD